MTTIDAQIGIDYRKQNRSLKIIIVLLLCFMLFDVTLYQYWRAEEVHEKLDGLCCRKCEDIYGSLFNQTIGNISIPLNASE